ncbi:MAG: hypothetical protein L3J57_13575 [Desulfuromusa sp.]|nr:hypothetical protein [Desulfuromusa sp.]
MTVAIEIVFKIAQVSEVVDITGKDVESPPATGKGDDLYIQELGKIGEKVKIFLNFEALVEEDDMDENLTEMEVA